MSEIEQLNKQKEDIESNLNVLKNWTELKKRLNKKYKSPSDAYKALLKEGKDSLSTDDFAEFSKDLDLQTLFKDTKLNEENFAKCWEQWEYQAKQNEHKLQIINEKLELLNMLEKNNNSKEGNKSQDNQKNKKILNLIQNCENLDELKDKLETLVQGSQKQKDPQDVIENEQSCFSEILSKKSEIKDPELQIKKIAQKQVSEVQSESGQQQQEQQQQQQQQQSQKKKNQTTYLTSQNTKLQKSDISLNVKNQNSSLQISRISQANQNKQSYIFDSQVQISPQKGQQQLKNASVTAKQSLQSPNEDRDTERRSHKSNRMRQELSGYISSLFQSENPQKEQRINKYRSEPQSQVQSRSLSGFPNLNQYYKIQQQQQQQQYRERTDPEQDNIFKRVQNIRYKLDDFQNQKLNQIQYQPRPKQERTPERQTRLSQPKSKLNNRKTSPDYIPGNTHRLNLDKLKSEKEQQSSGQSAEKPQQQQKPQQETQPESESLSMDQLNQTLKGDSQGMP